VGTACRDPILGIVMYRVRVRVRVGRVVRPTHSN